MPNECGTSRCSCSSQSLIGSVNPVFLRVRIDSGSGVFGAAESLPIEELQQQFQTLVFGHIEICHRALEAMQQQGHGLIINVTSDAGVQAYPTWGGYGASKAALEHLSRVLAAELEGSGVRVYVVDPGDMNTQMLQEAYPGEDVSDRALPEASVPGFLALLGADGSQPLPSGRYAAREIEVAHE